MHGLHAVLFYKFVRFFGSLAQLVEQRTFNPLVAGSNPARPTKHLGVFQRTSPEVLFLFMLSFVYTCRSCSSLHSAFQARGIRMQAASAHPSTGCSGVASVS